MNDIETLKGKVEALLNQNLLLTEEVEEAKLAAEEARGAEARAVGKLHDVNNLFAMTIRETRGNFFITRRYVDQQYLATNGLWIRDRGRGRAFRSLQEAEEALQGLHVPSVGDMLGLGDWDRDEGIALRAAPAEEGVQIRDVEETIGRFHAFWYPTPVQANETGTAWVTVPAPDPEVPEAITPQPTPEEYPRF